MKTLAFLNLEHRSVDADGWPLDDFKFEVGDEMIVEVNDETQEAIGDNSCGSFRFTDLKKEELSQYVSLQELTGVRFVDGHFGIGEKQ